jgi:hypothetical protein
MRAESETTPGPAPKPTTPKPPKPELIEVDYDGIPDFLVGLDRWAGWWLTPTISKKDGARSWTKPPRLPDGSNASHSNPATWSPFDDVMEAFNNDRQFDGLGVMMGTLPNRDVLLGIDLDTCVFDGVLSAWAVPLVTCLIEAGAYIEYSPTGTGLKAFARVSARTAAALPKILPLSRPDKTGFKRAIANGHANGGKGHPPAVEVYFDNRFFCTTGVPWKASKARDVTVLSEAALRQFVALLPRAAHSTSASAEGVVDRSTLAYNRAKEFRRNGGQREDLETHLRSYRLCAEWLDQKNSDAERERHLDMIWDDLVRKDPDGAGQQRRPTQGQEWDRDPEPDPELLENPDMRVLQQYEREPPPFPIEVFGNQWGDWLQENAVAASAPVDYVVAIVLSSVAALIGNARWAQATPNWREPTCLWCVPMSPSGTKKSPGADVMIKEVLPELQRRMMADWPDQRRAALISLNAWNRADKEWREAIEDEDEELPEPAQGTQPPEPQPPQLWQSDTTVEKLASLQAANPKGMLLIRDELAGWLYSMNVYNASGRQFWIECFGGRPYTLTRQKHPHPIIIPRLNNSVYGTIQPDRLAEIIRKEPDDGLLPRMLYFWPYTVPYRIGREPMDTPWAIEALDRLRKLKLKQVGDRLEPVYVPLTAQALDRLEAFGQKTNKQKELAAGMLRSTYGKAPGFALRLALILRYMWWCADEDLPDEPTKIGGRAMNAAIKLVGDYFMPMAERVYGDADCPPADKHAATIARWIIRERMNEVYVRDLLRGKCPGGKLPGLSDAITIKIGCRALIEAGWLYPPELGYGAASKVVYGVNPRVHERAKAAA